MGSRLRDPQTGPPASSRPMACEFLILRDTLYRRPFCECIHLAFTSLHGGGLLGFRRPSFNRQSSPGCEALRGQPQFWSAAARIKVRGRPPAGSERAPPFEPCPTGCVWGMVSGVSKYPLQNRVCSKDGQNPNLMGSSLTSPPMSVTSS